MGSPVVHWELMSKDPAKVADFYAKIFGWEVQHMGGPVDYRIVDTGGNGGINGGILKPEREGPWPIARRSSPRAARSTSRSRRCPAWAKFSLFTDPEGRMMGLWKSKQM